VDWFQAATRGLGPRRKGASCCFGLLVRAIELVGQTGGHTTEENGKRQNGNVAPVNLTFLLSVRNLKMNYKCQNGKGILFLFKKKASYLHNSKFSDRFLDSRRHRYLRWARNEQVCHFFFETEVSS